MSSVLLGAVENVRVAPTQWSHRVRQGPQQEGLFVSPAEVCIWQFTDSFLNLRIGCGSFQRIEQSVKQLLDNLYM